MSEHLTKSAFHPFPELETERLLLTRMDLRFVEQKFALRTNLDVMRYFDRPIPTAMEEVRTKVEEGVQSMADGKALLWAILNKETRQFLGDVGYWRLDPDHAVAEIGYALLPDHWRQGIMGEALGVVLPYAFLKMGLHRVEANVNVDNVASSTLLVRAGFQKEAHFRENYFYNGQFLDSHIYGLLEKDLAVKQNG
ncbi:MAG: GNAT family N-acetyltransferase [Saprospiraceae bacterium]|nr:GNAT family N-acetyltransferase [Saprospiraceae bacterium]